MHMYYVAMQQYEIEKSYTEELIIIWIHYLLHYHEIVKINKML